MAYDQRFWTAYVSSSGEGRREIAPAGLGGETVENIAGPVPLYHWMAGNFLKYAGPLHASTIFPWIRTS